MKFISNFSGGLCSFWATHRTIERHGRENVVNLFADTLVEDGELYEFNAQASALLGLPIIRIADGRTPWELFEEAGMIGNNRFPICSLRLKREPLNAWMAGRFEMESNQDNALYEQATVVLGFDWTEAHRVVEFQQEHPRWTLYAPMTEEPIWDKCKMEAEARKLGLKIPRAYSLGFPHNNCGMRCVRAGISHWVHLLKVLPESFADWEDKEIETSKKLTARGIVPMSMLKDRRGGETRPLYLRDLRKRVEAGEQFDKYDWGGCGCGGATSSSTPAAIEQAGSGGTI